MGHDMGARSGINQPRIPQPASMSSKPTRQVSMCARDGCKAWGRCHLSASPALPNPSHCPKPKEDAQEQWAWHRLQGTNPQPERKSDRLTAVPLFSKCCPSVGYVWERRILNRVVFATHILFLNSSPRRNESADPSRFPQEETAAQNILPTLCSSPTQ